MRQAVVRFSPTRSASSGAVAGSGAAAMASSRAAARCTDWIRPPLTPAVGSFIIRTPVAVYERGVAVSMDLTLTAAQHDLQARTRALTGAIMVHELACEEGNGLPDEALAEISARVRELRLHAINMPAEWGGQGLSVLDQVLVQEELGRLTNALWDTVWR